ncbi:MSHA biogenesis protein MshP [Aquabacterium sp. OR-4]|uniref:MSHA biogenesis protein MshP n=1 Tax=Aquabacterium sp. OR-4 TaxID=2978127 RepID=UPI0028C886F2|nr:MSHA biogenesis protein MshP [Aquabacterium sp. OR-4]MDT7836893.1 MSHA biogenesis protein MshP [Aquabacterium sp. OR-4]
MIIVLVTLAGLAAAVLRLGQQAQITSTQDVLALRAAAAARAGIEWGLYQAFKGSWTSCSNTSQALDLNADLGMVVSVSCDSRLYNEGESAPGVAQTLRVYTIEALACNAAACPDAAAAVRTGYVERRRQIHAVNAQ